MTSPPNERQFYRWRRMTDDERAEVLAERKANRRPWHSPPHFEHDSKLYLITGACYEHRPVIGASIQRMTEFSRALTDMFDQAERNLFAWCVLPNHYHCVARSPKVRDLLTDLGRLHGRTSYQWNIEENCRGRQVWFSAAETGIKSERHYSASQLYVWHNAVKHGYVQRWQDWPYSNAAEWLEAVGWEEAVRVWNEYPIDEFGAEWDPPEL